MIKAVKYVRKVLKFGTFFGTAGFLVATLIQIYARFFMEKAPSWTEEAARLFFVFAIGCASGLAMRGNYYVHFDFLFNRLGAYGKHCIKIIIYAVLTILFVIFTYHAVQFSALGWSEKSPSLRLPMTTAFIGVVIMGCSITFFAIVQLVKLLGKR